MSKNKKQMIVMGALALVIVAVGAFQFMGGKSEPAPAVETEEPATQATGEEIAKGDETTDRGFRDWPVDDDFFGLLDKRDPFQAQARILDEPKDDKKPQTWTDPNAGSPKPEITGNSGYKPVSTGPPGSDNLTPGRAAGEPPFDVVGIIQGSRSTMAILNPDGGRQLMVSVGDKIDGMTVTAITSNTVHVRYKGSSKTLDFRKTSSK